MCCKMTQNVSLDLVYVLAHKPYSILIVHRNNCFEMIRNVKLKNVIKQVLIKVTTSNWNTVCQ